MTAADSRVQPTVEGRQRPEGGVQEMTAALVEDGEVDWALRGCGRGRWQVGAARAVGE